MHMTNGAARGSSSSGNILIIVVVVLSLFYIVSYFALAGARIQYPYELAYTESANAAEFAQVSAGKPAYSSPDVHYAPLVYTPLNFYAAKVLRHLNPGPYFGLRLSAILGTIITSLVIILVSLKARASAWAIIAAVGVFLGAFTRCGFIMDSGHVDSLALAFSISALALLYEGRRSLPIAAMAGLLAGLGFLTKQTMVAFIAIPFLWLILQKEWRRAAVFCFMSMVAIIGLLAWWGMLSNKWFYFFVFGLESTMHIDIHELLIDAPIYLVLCLPAGLLIGLFGSSSGVAGWKDVPKRWFLDPWAVTLFLYAGASLIAKAKDGGGENVFLPVVALGAVQIGRYLSRLAVDRPRQIPALIIVQLLVLFYPPTLLWPVQADLDAGDRLVEQIRKINGDVYIPAFPEYAVRAGKPWFVHYTVSCGRLDFHNALRDELAGMVRAQKFGAIIPRQDIEKQDRGVCEVPLLEEFYEPVEDVIMPPRPSAREILLGRPSLSGVAHGGKFTKIYVPKKTAPKNLVSP
ncbi:MAG: hypothetical protein WC889_13275 [Myxococcota bacterium]|jgi:hypothetical protein